jgi:hypothetical protein
MGSLPATASHSCSSRRGAGWVDERPARGHARLTRATPPTGGGCGRRRLACVPVGRNPRAADALRAEVVTTGTASGIDPVPPASSAPAQTARGSVVRRAALTAVPSGVVRHNQPRSHSGPFRGKDAGQAARCRWSRVAARPGTTSGASAAAPVCSGSTTGRATTTWNNGRSRTWASPWTSTRPPRTPSRSCATAGTT